MNAPRILIVEDDEDLASEIQCSLEAMGNNVIGHAASAVEALDLARRFEPTLALVDVELKGQAVDGVAIAHELRTRGRTAIVYITGRSDASTVARAKETAPVAYLLKPFGERELAVTVELAVARQQLEAKQEDEREAMQRMQRLDAVGVLAGGIAHDFNNLLAVIAASVSFATRKLPADERNVHILLERALTACDRATSLTKQLLTFSSGGAPVRRATAIAELVRTSVEFGLHGSICRAAFDIAPDLRIADVDEGQIGQVLTNLALNASEAMPKGGVVHVSARNRTLEEANAFGCAPGAYVEVAVKDHGVGIAPEILARVFEPYFSTKQRGSGLGLAAAYSIARQHGGALIAESKVNGGSTFRLVVPASARAAASAQQGAAQDTGASPAGVRVLVMDDEDALRTALTGMLTELGYDVEGSADGAAAVRSFVRAREAGRPFDVVLLDLTVRGGMGGLETVKQLLAIDPKTRAIATSGYAPDPILGNPERYGFTASLPKPFRLNELMTILQRTARPE